MSTPDTQLIEFLVDNCQTARFDGRSQLIDGILDRSYFDRDESNQVRDLQLIVKRIRTDRTALRILVGNAGLYLGEQEVQRLRNLVDAVRARPLARALELGAPHRFDLNSVIDQCVPIIRARKGLIGFTVNSQCVRLVDYLVERVKDHMSTFGVPLTRKINTVGGLKAIPTAIAQVSKLRTTLAMQNIVCSAVVSDGTAAAELWAGSTATLASCTNRFVLFMLVQEPCSAPDGMLTLQSPVFYQHHAEDWWGEVLEVRSWGHGRLTDILCGFAQPVQPAESNELDMEVVYDDLADAIDLLKRHTDEDSFHEAWAKLKQGAV